MMAKSSVSKEIKNTDVNWNDFVLTLFDESELVDGVPNCAGLRRVTELLVGPIVVSRPKQIFPVVDDLSRRATVSYEINVLVDQNNKYGYIGREGLLSYEDVADVDRNNTEYLYLAHSVATASTRAEARALRKLLKLRVISAEENTKVDLSQTMSESDPDRLSEPQIIVLDKQCSKMDIDVNKFINSGEKKYLSIYEIKRDTAIKMIEVLNDYNNNRTSIPDDIKGYKENWRK